MDKNRRNQLRNRGAADRRAGKPITAYYETPLSWRRQRKHTERGRCQYEIGWRHPDRIQGGEK